MRFPIHIVIIMISNYFIIFYLQLLTNTPDDIEGRDVGIDFAGLWGKINHVKTRLPGSLFLVMQRNIGCITTHKLILAQR